MCVICDGGTPEQDRAWFRRTMRRFGWALQHVEGDEADTSFTYTVGLMQRQIPELVVFGLPSRTSKDLLNQLGHELWHHGRRLAAGERLPDRLALPDDTDLPLAVVEVVDSSATLLTANDLCRQPDGRPVPAFQLVWPDYAGRFPWQAGYALPVRDQPLLGGVRASGRSAA